MTGNVANKRNNVLMFAKEKESQMDGVSITLPGNPDSGTLGHLNIHLLSSTFKTDGEESMSQLYISSTHWRAGKLPCVRKSGIK